MPFGVVALRGCAIIPAVLHHTLNLQGAFCVEAVSHYGSTTSTERLRSLTCLKRYASVLFPTCDMLRIMR